MTKFMRNILHTRQLCSSHDEDLGGRAQGKWSPTHKAHGNGTTHYRQVEPLSAVGQSTRRSEPLFGHAVWDRTGSDWGVPDSAFCVYYILNKASALRLQWTRVRAGFRAALREGAAASP
jgi:hypothetical protein